MTTSPGRDLEARYGLQDHAVCRPTNTGLVMLFDRERGVMYELNESASAIVAELKVEPRTVEELTRLMETRFEASAAELAEDVKSLLLDFAECGLVASVPE